MAKAMPDKKLNSIGAFDVTLAGTLISSPVWVDWVHGLNELLGTLSLLIGLILGVCRLWWAWNDRQRKGSVNE